MKKHTIPIYAISYFLSPVSKSPFTIKDIFIKNGDNIFSQLLLIKKHECSCIYSNLFISRSLTRMIITV